MKMEKAEAGIDVSDKITRHVMATDCKRSAGRCALYNAIYIYVAAVCRYEIYRFDV